MTDKTPKVPLARFEKLVIAAALVAMVVAVLVPTGFYLSSREQAARDDREQAAQDAKDEASLMDRRIESCKAFNQDQTNDRNTAIHGLRQFAIVFLNVTPDEADAALASDDGREFVAFINGENPYRTCTPDCVVAEFDPAIENCGPADNPEGNP